MDIISKEPNDSERLYSYAKICLDNEQLGCFIFDQITQYLRIAISGYDTKATELSETPETSSQYVQACLRFLKCSYWLPSKHYHYITLDLLNLLLSSLGHALLDGLAHDTLSALLSLLLANSSVVVLNATRLPSDWVKTYSESGQCIIRSDILQDLFFRRLAGLPSDYFTDSASVAFRTWFQWTSYALRNRTSVEAIYSSYYWEILRLGLLKGFSNQRKYCLGILQQSLALFNNDCNDPSMLFFIDKKDETINQYKKFSTLFETIVLDRYPNQVQACLPELTALSGDSSLISPTWVTALLSAALNPKLQDGIRKLVGNWYIQYVIKEHGPITTHLDFLLQGFLPWATQGSLFTSSLHSNRWNVSCAHGAALTEVITKFILAHPTLPEQRLIIRQIIGYILETGGKIFSPSVLFILEGLLIGIKQASINLSEAEADLVVKVSRLPAFPEIAADLCSIYCARICEHLDSLTQNQDDPPGLKVLLDTLQDLESQDPSGSQKFIKTHASIDNITTLQDFLGELEKTQHSIIQNEAFAPACKRLSTTLDHVLPSSILPNELLQVLDAFWEEADRQEFPRLTAINLVLLMFHSACIRTCIAEQRDVEGKHRVTALLTKALTQLHRFAEGRTYLVSVLATSLRRACFLEPSIVDILPVADFIIRYIENPPVPKKEFLFEVVAAEKLQQTLPHRNYASYYGDREWIGHAAVIDLVNRFPQDRLPVMKNVLDRLLVAWRTQKAPVPIISKWKNIFQLQIMLLLTETCISATEVDHYLDQFMHALVLEPWPRYRHLLEWIIVRIYYHFPEKTHRILQDLAKLDENRPVHISSLMKLALLVTPFVNSQEFALQLVTLLIPFSASPKVHVRHEAHWSFPALFELAEENQWSKITGNPAFQALNRHIRKLDKFGAPPSTIRTLKLDAVKDFTVTNVFQGQYLKIETPEVEYVAHEDFVSLLNTDSNYSSATHASSPRVPLGELTPKAVSSEHLPAWGKQGAEAIEQEEPGSTFFQTKSGFNVASLLPAPGPPSAQQKRPASIILIASLIDNPTNLGGLSRISESFGLEALYIDDFKKTAHKDFKATSVTSEKHIPIRELKVPAIPEFLTSLKRQGYEIVGIEQTDRSGILGEEADGKGIGTLPKKCVFVLGSERGGITSEVLTAIDRCVEIKTVGVTRSLNVQTAGGIAVYEWWREWGSSI